MTVTYDDVRIGDHPIVDAAAWLAAAIRDAFDRRGAVRLAVSGGSTAPRLFAQLHVHDVPFGHVEVWQVDERVVPDGHPDRNLGQLGVLPWRVHPMPVEDADRERAVGEYAGSLPDRFDVVHLGVGDDGHTASWPPGDPVVEQTRPVAFVGAFHGHERMTITPTVVDAARARLVVATGAGKAPVIARWLSGDDELPASRIPAAATTIFLDRDAAAIALGNTD
jgi:6-phosphogluconolactonase/glucosamine-6-phosphate isomerase/deaminase